ncbi:MAG: ankyrin repeat domain-containing protein [Gammaproteobacteria bacterium]|nr:ankyrin repeat domain-containing protein [Gammaproteobacteria bacterium]
MEAWRTRDRFPGLTRLVQGAPGAGKSSLLAHLEKRWSEARSAGDRTAPVAVNLSLLDLRDPRRFRDAIAEKVPVSLGQRYAPVVAGALLKLVIPDARLSAETEKAVREELAGKRNLSNPVVLMVDEAQNARPGGDESAILAHIHEGHLDSLPILPVLAGLGFLREHLQQPGIRLTRFSDERQSVHTLGAISDAEVRDLFEGWLKHFRVVAEHGEAERWVDALVRDSQGWPMHTNHFLTALAGQLRMPGRDPCRLASADLLAVRRDAADRRLRYYETRYDNPLLDERARDVGKFMAELRAAGPATMKGALDLIQRAFRFESRESALAAFNALRERGFLQRVDGPGRRSASALRLYACPIPSLASFAAACESALHLAASAGDVDELRRLVRGGNAVGARDAMDRTPLHLAAECRWADAVGALLSTGADPDALDAAGTTPRGAWPEFEWPDSKGSAAN